MNHHVTIHSISSTWSESSVMMAVIANTGWVGVDTTTAEGSPTVLFRLNDTHSRITLLKFEDYEWLSDYLYANLSVIVWAKIFVLDDGEVYLKDMDIGEYLL